MSEKPFNWEEFKKYQKSLQTNNKAMYELSNMGMAKQKAEYVSAPEGEANPISKNSPNIVNQGRQTAAQIVDAVQPQPKISNQQAVQLAATQAPDQVKNIVDSMSGSENVRFQVKKLIDNPQALAQQQARIETQKAEGKPMGMVDQFVDGLQFFMPTAIGALVGAIGGGSAAGVAGAEAGTALGNDYREFKGKQFDRALKAKQVDADISAQQMASGINAMNADLRAQELSNTEKRIAMEMQREKRLQTMGNQQMGLRAESLGLRREELGQLDSGQVEKLAEIEIVREDLNSLNFKGLGGNNPAGTRVKDFISSLGISVGEDYDKNKAQLMGIVNEEIKRRYGTAVSGGEQNRAFADLPKSTDTDEQIVNKLSAFKNKLDLAIDTRLKVIKKTQSLKAGTVDKYKEQDVEPVKQPEPTDRAANLFTKLRR